MFRIAQRYAVAIACFTAMSAHAAEPRSFPAKPIRIVVPIAPGGSTDYLARLLAQKLGERVSQPIVVDNRPGAGGNIGTDVVAKAPPDGYTVVAANVSSVAINQSLYKKDAVAQLAAQGAQPEPMSREEFARYIKSEAQKWSAVVKASGATAD